MNTEGTQTRLGSLNLIYPSSDRNRIMSGTSDKPAGVTNEAVGKAKQGIGSAVGSDKLKAEGAAQEAKGDALRCQECGQEGRRQHGRRAQEAALAVSILNDSASAMTQKVPVNSGTFDGR
jgi:uncharacterized protein YjbJ (UPF0337 family)